MLGWVQNGTVRLHDRGGRRDLPEGRMFFAATGQPHALQGRGEAPMIVSVAFDPALVAGLAARHPQLGGHLFWAGAERPELDALDSRALADLNRAALRLERAAATSLAAEAFLLPLVARLAERRTAIPDGLPDWLARAMEAARDPAVFREGAAGLARVAGRAHPHVSRTMRRFTGQTPSDYVNARRMDFAARRLAGGEEPLAEIAAECGIPNLSHFHRLFRVAHGTTPAAYRRRFRAALERP
ncbi:helix-turn-helix transcriptional regulator [Wenxinia saemankumensis]|uniref:helix-turn-helix transcriptional regulator n=1 Tax=Wenxinia saemankumensis TaxID=1447782 RepID=UPI001FCDA1AA|nr:helix-turn-helix transcriptional regulator [Wenxinia saemankumensis]